MTRSSNFREEIERSDLQPLNMAQAEFLTQPRMPFRRETSWTSLSSQLQNRQDPASDVAWESKLPSDPLGREQIDQAGIRFGGLQVPRAYSPMSNQSEQDDCQTSWSAPYLSEGSRRLSSQTNIPLITRNHHILPDACASRDNIVMSGWSFFNGLVILFALLSWSLSGLFLGLAIAKPRWGFRVGTPDHLSYDTATLLSALLSKLVELTFASTFVITLGQILSRRAAADNNKGSSSQGVSLAELNMKFWIVQPGTFFTHFAGVKHAITSLLGISALVAAISATLYTTAAEALVAPKLLFGNNQTISMVGPYSANFGNVNYIGETCSSAIPTQDYIEVGSTCLQIDFAGNGFRNLQSWSAAWQMRQNTSTSTSVRESTPRPPPTALLYDNTTVNGLWIHPSGENITADSLKYGRFVQNTTMVMPHANVFHAAQDPSNNILQPNDLQGLGEYYIQAAVPVPGVNTLCVGVSTDEIQPLIGNGSSNSQPANWPNLTTPIDSLFGWSQDPDLVTTFPYPWFGKLPIEFNTVGNVSNTYGVESVYFIAKPPSRIVTQDYIVCGIRSFQYSDCSTSLFASSSGSDLSVNCGSPPQNWKSYEAAVVEGGSKPPVMVSNGADIMYVLQDWIRAVSLTSGITDADTSLARYVTQMIPTYTNNTATKLDPDSPSIGEAICVLAGYSLLRATDASPFVNDWDHQQSILTTPAVGNFTALASYKDYQSGGDVQWKSLFYVILAAVFLLNSFCLALLLYYFTLQGVVTDFTDLQNVFTLALNSPPSRAVAGACGGGPSAPMLGTKWWIDMKFADGMIHTPHPLSRSATSVVKNSHAHFFVHYDDEPSLAYNASHSTTSFASKVGKFFAGLTSGHGRAKLQKRTAIGGDDSELVDFGNNSQYMKLNGR